jgi:serine protease Do
MIADAMLTMDGLVGQNSQRLDYLLTSSTPAYNNAADIFRAIDNSVVSINVLTQQRQWGIIRDTHSAGSGIIFHETDERVYIVTNYHVVQNATHVMVSLDDVREVQARYVGGEERSDIAVIYVLRADLWEAGITNYQVAVFGDSDEMEIGNFVLAVGNAYGEGKSATLGIVSALDKVITVEGDVTLNVMRTDAAINPGNSGGPLVNTAGEVIGINTAKFMSGRSEGMGYAIPSNEVQDILRQVLETGDIQTAVLGIHLRTVTEELRVEHNLPATGIMVAYVIQGFAADEMGLAPADVITHFNGRRITDDAQLREMLRRTNVGSPIQVQIYRGNEQITLHGTMTGTRSTTNF